MEHTFNPNTQRQADLCEFEASLVYRVRSRTARATQINLVLKTTTTTTNNLSSEEWFQSRLVFLVEFRK